MLSSGLIGEILSGVEWTFEVDSDDYFLRVLTN